MRSLFAVWLFSISFIGYSQKIEITKMESILSKIDQKTLVVFDIDNTIVQPTQMLGSDQWYSYRVKFHENAGLSTDDAIDSALSEWTKVQLQTPVRAVERSTVQIIQNIQRRGIPVMALTARPIELARASRLQLKSVGVDLSHAHGFGNSDIEIDGEHSSLFTQGVLLVGAKNNKGKVLVEFLKMQNYHPRSIVFVDDKEKHVLNVGDALKELNVAYTGFRYGAADKYVAGFDIRIAEIQHKYFLSTGKFISDTEAKR